jgi:hypothetical protein
LPAEFVGNVCTSSSHFLNTTLSSQRNWFLFQKNEFLMFEFLVPCISLVVVHVPVCKHCAAHIQHSTLSLFRNFLNLFIVASALFVICCGFGFFKWSQSASKPNLFGAILRISISIIFLWFFLIDYNHFDFFYTFSSSCDFGHLSLHSHGRIIDWVSFSALHRGVYHAFASDVSSCSIFFSVNAGWMFYGHVQHLYCANWLQDLLVIFEALVHPLIVLPHHVLVGFICQHPVGPHQYFFSSHQHGHC